MTDNLVQAQFGKNAAHYATSSVHAKGASLVRLIETTEPKPQWSMLDIATGAGHTALAFAPYVASVTASDITSEMLGQARKLADDRGLTNLHYAEADAQALPFDDGAFDLVTCRIAPHHFPDVAAFVREAHRVLKPGGTFGLVDNLAPDDNTDAGREPAELVAAADAYNALEKLRDPSHGRALTHGEWLSLIAAGGFDVRHTEHLAKVMSFDRWCLNMSVEPDRAETLRGMFANASAALRSYLKVDDVPASGTDFPFTLTELLVVARAR